MHSITYGEVSFEEMYQLIRVYTAQDENVKYELAVGTDSQNYSYTKVPITIGVHKIVNNVGRGGIHIWLQVWLTDYQNEGWII